ncbi:MAG: S8 family serine peptidase [Bacteroidales bacterium]|jgi:subtilisin family serine protease|nr:S8 family serine peptidase [Bacteroidales bacterium]
MKKRYISILLLFTFINAFSQKQRSPEELRIITEQSIERIKQKRSEEIQRANNLGIPLVINTPDGPIHFEGFIYDTPVYHRPTNSGSAANINTNMLHTGGGANLNLNGEGIIIREWDNGKVYEKHPELEGKVIQVEGIYGKYENHATHVAGILIAKGINGKAKGMAPKAKLRVFLSGDAYGDMLTELHYRPLVSNHSYGNYGGWDTRKNNEGNIFWVWRGDNSISSKEDYTFGLYSEEDQKYDKIAYIAPYYTIVKAAGNDRNQYPGPEQEHIDEAIAKYGEHPADGPFDCISSGNLAKNIITVGAVDHIDGNYINEESVIISSFTAWGPVDDGRIKPDITAVGHNVISTVYDNDDDPHNLGEGYDIMAGTSMAAPAVTGSIALLQQHYQNLFGQNRFMRSSTVKGLIIHTAKECGSHKGPDYKFGWGLMDSYAAAMLITKTKETCLNIKEYEISNGEVIKIPIAKIADQEIKVTICWTDPAGEVQPKMLDPEDKTLVNDIDLRIRRETKIYYPWILDKDNPENAAQKGDNSIDNVEQVIVNGRAGLYEVEISHKNSLKSGSQIVSVIISGVDDLTKDFYINDLDDRQFEDEPFPIVIASGKNVYAHNLLFYDPMDFEFCAKESIVLSDEIRISAGSNFKAKIFDYSCNDVAVPIKYEINRTPEEEPVLEIQTEKNEKPEIDSESKYDDLVIYPNPTNGIFNIQINSNKKVNRIDIIDISGRLIYNTKNTDSNNIKIDLSGFNKGIYFVKVHINNNTITKQITVK